MSDHKCEKHLCRNRYVKGGEYMPRDALKCGICGAKYPAVAALDSRKLAVFIRHNTGDYCHQSLGRSLAYSQALTERQRRRVRDCTPIAVPAHAPAGAIGWARVEMARRRAMRKVRLDPAAT